MHATVRRPQRRRPGAKRLCQGAGRRCRRSGQTVLTLLPLAARRLRVAEGSTASYTVRLGSRPAAIVAFNATVACLREQQATPTATPAATPDPATPTPTATGTAGPDAPAPTAAVGGMPTPAASPAVTDTPTPTPTVTGPANDCLSVVGTQRGLAGALPTPHSPRKSSYLHVAVCMLDYLHKCGTYLWPSVPSRVPTYIHVILLMSNCYITGDIKVPPIVQNRARHNSTSAVTSVKTQYRRMSEDTLLASYVRRYA